VNNDCFKIFDADDDMHARLHSELFKVGCIDCDCSDEWVLQDLLPVRDLFCIALKDAATICASEDVKHFSFGTEVLSIFLHSTRVHAPPIFRYVAIEKRVHDVDSFIREFVGLDDALVAYHLNDESALCLVLPLLHANFTAINCTIAP
jgi:hypothetical protein